MPVLCHTRRMTLLQASLPKWFPPKIPERSLLFASAAFQHAPLPASSGLPSKQSISSHTMHILASKETGKGSGNTAILSLESGKNFRIIDGYIGLA